MKTHRHQPQLPFFALSDRGFVQIEWFDRLPRHCCVPQAEIKRKIEPETLA